MTPDARTPRAVASFERSVVADVSKAHASLPRLRRGSAEAALAARRATLVAFAPMFAADATVQAAIGRITNAYGAQLEHVNTLDALRNPDFPERWKVAFDEANTWTRPRAGSGGGHAAIALLLLLIAQAQRRGVPAAPALVGKTAVGWWGDEPNADGPPPRALQTAERDRVGCQVILHWGARRCLSCGARLGSSRSTRDRYCAVHAVDSKPLRHRRDYLDECRRRALERIVEAMYIVNATPESAQRRRKSFTPTPPAPAGDRSPSPAQQAAALGSTVEWLRAASEIDIVRATARRLLADGVPEEEIADVLMFLASGSLPLARA